MNHKARRSILHPKYPIFDTKIFLVAASLSDFEILTRAKYPYILTSYFFSDKVFQKGLKNFKDLFEFFNADIKDYELFIDSGSYSITAGKHKYTDKELLEYMDDYIDFLYTNQSYYSLYCNLDMQFDIERSKMCYRHLCANGLHDSVQVHHRPERLNWLEEIYNKYTNPKTTVIGLSPQPAAGPSLKWEYTKRCLGLFKGNIKIHLLGSVDVKILTHFNIYSCDSSGASRTASTGSIRTPVGTVDVGDRRSHPQHVYNIPRKKVDEIENYLRTLGYSGIEEVTGNEIGVSRERLYITILSYKDTMEKIKEKKKLIVLPSRRDVLKEPWSPEYGDYSRDGVVPKDWK